MWQNWTNAVLGLVIIAALFMGLSASTLAWTVGVVAALIVIFGFWGAGATSYDDSHSNISRHA